MNVRHVAVCAVAGILLAACSTNTKVATNKASPNPHATINAAALVAAAPGVTSALGSAKEVTTVTSTFGGMGTFFSSNGAVNFAKNQAEITTTVMGTSERTIVDGTTVYSSIPADSGAPAGKSWIKISSSDLSQFGQDAGASSGLGGMFPGTNDDPADGLQILSGVSGTVTTVGTETVGGVSTTHYRFAADLTKAMQNVPAGEQASFKAMESSMGLQSPTVDVWIDGSGVARQLAYNASINLNPALGGATPPPGMTPNLSGTFVITTNFSDFGTPVSITDPPASEVASLSQMMQDDPTDFGSP